MSCSSFIGSVPGDLSHCLHLPVSFDDFDVDHGGRLSAMGCVGPLAVVKGDLAFNTGLRPGFPSLLESQNSG